MLETLAVRNYRTLRDLVVPLGRLNLVTGANGTGKSNLYRALRLLAEIAQGGVIASLAREGGMSSVLWAGPESISRAMRRREVPVQGTVRTRSVSLGLGFIGEAFSYSIDIGWSTSTSSVFVLDPAIKGEALWTGPLPRPSAMLVERRRGHVRARDESHEWSTMHDSLADFDSMMTQVADPRHTPELLALREGIRSWRFYDHFRSDAGAPMRQPQIGTHTPVLGHDGADLAAALQTIREIGDSAALDQVVDDAFPGARVDIEANDGRFETVMHQPGLLRPLKALELSDGTLRYLLWIAALLSPRPPGLLVLNEPETSLHPDLLAPLARLIGRAAQQSQVIVVSHAAGLIAGLQAQDCQSLILEKDLGETRVRGLRDLDRPAWRWIER